MSFDEQLQQAFDTLTDRLRDEISRQVRTVVDELAAAARADRGRASEEAAQATANAARQAAENAAADQRAAWKNADLTARERLLAAIRAIDRARSLTDVFDALSVGAEREAPRAAVLLVRDSVLRGWRFTGFGPAFDHSHDTQLPVDASGVVADALRTMTSASATTSDRSAAPPFELADGRMRMAFPMAIAGEAVAVLYADEGLEQAPADDKTGWPVSVEILARHAARTLEALTAFKTAATLAGGGSVQPISSSGPPSGASDADEAARRYARLLVSEIKMYHEAEIAAGRRERDLATRLGGEIERARTLYEQRVPEQVRLRTDFFHAELVRTLADGDARLLEIKS